MQRLLLLVCLCLAVPSMLSAQEPAATNRDSWFFASVQPPPWDHEIHRERILPVPSGQARDAVAMLQAKSSVPLSLPVAAKLLGVTSIDPDALLEQAARKKEDAQAEERERASKDPFLRRRHGGEHEAIGQGASTDRCPGPQSQRKDKAVSCSRTGPQRRHRQFLGLSEGLDTMGLPWVPW